MIRLITARRLRALLDELRQVRREADQVRHLGQVHLTGKLLAEQARDHFKEQAEFWKSRASRFLDQEHLKAGTIDSPVMGEATPPAESTTQRLMSALNVREIHKPSAEKMPPAAAILGVSDAAARAAVAGVLDPS